MIKLLFSLFLLTAVTAFSAEEQAPAAANQGIWQTLIMVGIVFAIFYLILWRPEQKRRKVMEQLRNSLQSGDRIVAMGIIGTVDTIKDDTLILKMVEGAKVEVLRGAVSEILQDTPTK